MSLFHLTPNSCNFRFYLNRIYLGIDSSVFFCSSFNWELSLIQKKAKQILTTEYVCLCEWEARCCRHRFTFSAIGTKIYFSIVDVAFIVFVVSLVFFSLNSSEKRCLCRSFVPFFLCQSFSDDKVKHRKSKKEERLKKCLSCCVNETKSKIGERQQ